MMKTALCHALLFALGLHFLFVDVSFAGKGKSPRKTASLAQAMQISCNGDLTFFVVNAKSASRINQAGFSGRFNAEQLQMILVGVLKDQPWLEIHPWWSVGILKLRDPSIPGATLEYENTETSFTVVLREKDGQQSSLSCSVEN